MVVDLTELEDFAAAAAANIVRFEVKFVLSPTLMAKDPFCIERVLLYMIGEAKLKESTLLERYRSALGQDDAVLPDRVI